MSVLFVQEHWSQLNSLPVLGNCRILKCVEMLRDSFLYYSNLAVIGLFVTFQGYSWGKMGDACESKSGKNEVTWNINEMADKDCEFDLFDC